MTDADALLQSILAAPDDDAPRLIYADWLDEHGDADRAAFIRAQIELACTRPNHSKHDSLVQIERTLLGKHAEAWSAWVPVWVRERKYHRGFLDWVRCDADAFIAGADVLRRHTPLAGARLDGNRHIARPLFISRCLEGLRSLTLSIDNMPRGDWTGLADCPYLYRLRELILNSKGPADELVSALMSPETLPALRRLRLTWCRLGDEQSSRLVQHKWSTRLRALDLRNNFIGDEGAIAMAESPYLDRLVMLNLKGNAFAIDGWVAEKLRQRFGSRLRL
ncbi:MAG TPA: TIGR02996 domain-containing protein [Gemmataceae bacterium]|jgi:uncharacterized protein (TIGR02996 family)|nr:TIGR02996 domain-containing protein [Gemmataceae bacterium]